MLINETNNMRNYCKAGKQNRQAVEKKMTTYKKNPSQNVHGVHFYIEMMYRQHH